MPDDHTVARIYGTQNQPHQVPKITSTRLTQYLITQTIQQPIEEALDLEVWNPLSISRLFQSLEKRVREKHSQTELKEESIEELPDLAPIGKIEDIAQKYEERNHELRAHFLIALRARLLKEDSVEEIIKKTKESFLDVSLRDEALDFLIETTDGLQQSNVEKAQQQLRSIHGQDIRAGRNMGAQARDFATQGLGSPTALRDIYRDIISNPRTPQTLFQELSSRFPFEKMKQVIAFVLHAIGADIKAKGPSIPRGELQNLLNETRDMQAILGIFRFFFSRMPLIVSLFSRKGLIVPPSFDFEILAKLFVQMIQERYPSVNKILPLSKHLMIAGQPSAQIILYLQYRDAIRQVAPRLFRNEKHRQELLLSLIETLEELEEQEEKEKGNLDQKKKGGKKEKKDG